MASLTFGHREMWEALGISRREFYRLKAMGMFRHLETEIPNRYSVEKTEAWLAGRSVHRVKLRLAS